MASRSRLAVVLGVAALSYGQTAPQPAVPPGCALDGVVVNAITGQPVPRARVSLTHGRGAEAQTADSSGRWAMKDAGCGQVQLRVNKAGFLPATLAGTHGVQPVPLVLAAGTPLHDLRLEMQPQSVVVGKVTDDQGDAVQGASVVAFAARVAEGRIGFVPSGMAGTNDMGEFRLAGLARGRYIVCAGLTNIGVASPGYGERCYRGPVEGGLVNAAELLPGQETRMDFELNPARGVHVRGTVSGGPHGKPLGITLRRSDVNGVAAPVSTVTSPQGAFEFSNVQPGQWVLVGDYFDQAKRLTVRQSLQVGSVDVENVTALFDAAGTIRANVRMESVSGKAQPELFGVFLRSADSTGSAGQVVWDTGGNSFSVRDVIAGNYRLQTVPRGRYYVKSATLGSQDILNASAALSASSGPIEIVLRDDGGSIEGEVADSSGQPVWSGVMAVSKAGGRPVESIAQEGRFKLGLLAPGEYIMYAWETPAEVQWAEPDWMRQYGSSGVSVTVNAGQTVSIKLIRQDLPR